VARGTHCAAAGPPAPRPGVDDGAGRARDRHAGLGRLPRARRRARPAARRGGGGLRCGPVGARHTVVAGRPVVRDGRLVAPRVEEILARHRRAAARMQGLEG
jgi:hypothetical protein